MKFINLAKFSFAILAVVILSSCVKGMLFSNIVSERDDVLINAISSSERHG